MKGADRRKTRDSVMRKKQQLQDSWKFLNREKKKIASFFRQLFSMVASLT